MKKPFGWELRLCCVGYFALGMVALSPATQAATDHVTCDKYAQTALIHQQQANKRNCGFPEYGWKAPYQAHYTWCKRVSVQAVNSEIMKREKRLRDCKAKNVPLPHCDRYAKTALLQQERAKTFKCNFSDYGWKAPYKAHDTWCRRVTAQQTQQEINKRNDRLKLCAARFWTNYGAFCRSYADTATKQTKDAHCYPLLSHPGRWDKNRAPHINWCLDVFKHAIFNNLTKSPQEITAALNKARDSVNAETKARENKKGCVPNAKWKHKKTNTAKAKYEAQKNAKAWKKRMEEWKKQHKK